VGTGSGDGSGRAAGVKPGALSALLQAVAAAPEPRDAEPAPLLPGTVVGRFEILRELGRGGFGVVYEARDRELGRQVALKFVRPGQAEMEEGKVAREAEAIARLAHPNLITLYDVGRTDHGPYLVFELLRGKTLQERIDDGPMPLQEAVHIATEVARGLAHAHAEGVVHRDLKPSNVFVTAKGQVKILDFGMAHAFGRRRLSGGTPAYMAPEQWEDAPEDERTDVFALGVMLYRMLSGEYPFPEGKGKWSAEPTTVRKLDVPGAPELADLVEKMLDRTPTRRPRDGAAVLAALTPIEDALRMKPADGAPPSHARRRTPTLGERLSGKSRRGLLGLAAVGLVAVLAAGGWSLWKLGPGKQAVPWPEGQPSIAVLPFADMSPGKDQEYLSDGMADEIISALSQVKGLKVSGRTSSFSFKGKNVKLADVGRELAVGSVLEGGVRTDGTRIRVTATVVNASDGFHVWSQTWERDLRDILSVENEIAREVVAALKVRLLGGGIPAVPEPQPTTAEAHLHLLRGRDAFRRGSSEDITRSVAEYGLAVKADPTLSTAWAGLAQVLEFSGEGADQASVLATKRKALDAANKAVATGPSNPEGYRVRAFIRGLLRHEWAEAWADIEKAISLGDKSGDVHYERSRLLALFGRLPEALAEAERAVEIDPLNTYVLMGSGLIATGMGDFEASRRTWERILQIAPDHFGASAFLSQALIVAGRPQEALSEAARSRGVDPWRLQVIALAEHALGHPQASQRAFDELLARHAHNMPFQIAEVCGWRGHADCAFQFLHQAADYLDGGLTFLTYSPFLAGIRGDPRWAAFLRKLNLPVGGGMPEARQADGASPPSIAVLPFADMSPKHDQEYFADGVAEEIRNALAHLEGLKVIGRTSSFSFRGKTDDLKTIGQKLGVANVLEGGLRRDGNDIRITAQLIRVADGAHLWSESYDRKATAILKVQEEIAGAVTKALRLRLLPTDRSAPRSLDPDAYASYLLGRQLLSRMTHEELPRAIASFEKAVAVEPTFAEAWAGLSHALDERSGWQSSLEGILRDKRKALDAGNRAVELAPGVGAGYAARAQLVDIRGWDWQGSIADARRAVELAPGDVQARIVLGGLLSGTGNGAAVRELRRATELDPLSTLAWSQLGLAANLAGDRELGAAAHARAREINPRNDWRNLVAKGSKEWAEAVLREPVGPLDTLIRTDRVVAFRFLGREAEARAAMEELIACCSFTGAWQIAYTYENAGDRDKAFEWLERARVYMDGGIRNLKLSPRYKGDPRTAAILKKMNLPVD